MPRNLLSDVDVVAISIVNKGANRKRFFLRKEDAGEELINLPAPHRLIKRDDWSAVWCVVAEPGWEENPGQGAQDQTVLDVWKSEDEILRAAHKFMRNGALVNKMHESLEPYGAVVENFVAPVEFSINDEVIQKGSWVVGIEPSEEGKAKIEAGEFTGVSVQGTGLRELENDVQTDKDATLEVSTMDAAEKKGLLTGFAKAIGLSVDDLEDQGETGVADKETTERLVKVEETVTKTNEALDKTVEAIGKLNEKLDKLGEDLKEATAEENDPAEGIFSRLDEVTSSIDGIRSDVEALAKGHSTQPEDQGSNGKVNKSDNPLAGILFGD